jgi:hypothetical protein
LLNEKRNNLIDIHRKRFSMCSLNARQIIEELLLPEVSTFPQESLTMGARAPARWTCCGDLQSAYSP